jgi:nucleoside-diphosphate-sugar epimerase
MTNAGTETVLVTGATGGIGSAAVRGFSEAGYRVVGIDLEDVAETAADEYRAGDLLDPDVVDAAVAESGADAVVHLGTLPNPVGRPGHVTYESNAMTTYHVLEAAANHGVEDVVVASSINAMGASFQADPMEVEYLPVDEEHLLTPRDPYALGKRTVELQADGFGRRGGPPHSIVSARYPWVGSLDGLREQFVEVDRTLEGIPDRAYATRNDLFAYIARPDAVRLLVRAVEADVGGHETVFATAADTTMATPSERLAEEYYPGAECGDLPGTTSLVDCSKARHLLGWEPRVSWRDLASDANVAAEWEAARQRRERGGFVGSTPGRSTPF